MKTVLLLLFIAAPAAAQPASSIDCQISAQPLTVRAEGQAEITGDVVIACAGGTVPAAGTPLPVANFVVRLSTNITSRLVSDTLTEVLLFIDDPQPFAQTIGGVQLPVQSPCTGPNCVCGPFAAGSNGAALDSSGVARNVFQGARLNANTIVFTGVPVHASGFNGTRVFRIKNLRAAAAGMLPGSFIYANTSVQNAPANLLLRNPTIGVAVVQPGIQMDLRSRSGGEFSPGGQVPAVLFQCQNWNLDLANADTARYSGANNDFGGRSMQIRFREAQPGAFRVRDTGFPLTDSGEQSTPQLNYGGPLPQGVPFQRLPESGFFNRSFPATNGLNRAGRADHGTRLRATFTNVPVNVRVYVSAHSLSSVSGTIDSSNRQSGGGETSQQAAAYAVTDSPSGSIPITPTSDAERLPSDGQYPANALPGLIEVPVSGGSGTVQWEVFSQNPNVIDTLSFAVSFAFRANNAGVGAISISGGYAPASDVATSSSTVPLPRFAAEQNIPGIPAVALGIHPCRADGCGFGLSASGITMLDTGGPASFTLFASSGNCNWTASSTVPWITITSTPSGSGTSTLNFFVEPNPAATRFGAVNIAGLALSVTQGGRPGSCSYGLSHGSFSIAASGGVLKVNLATQPGCEWTSFSRESWMTISPPVSIGTGPATIPIQVLPNPGSSLRTGFVSLGGIDFLVSQRASEVTGGALRFVPLEPCRVMETRPEYNFQGRTGPFGPPYLRANEIRNLTLSQSNVCAIPLTARAYLFNVTLIPRANRLNYVSLHPANETVPQYVTIRSPDGQTIANSAIVRSSADGRIAVASSDDMDVVLDISGYYTDNAFESDLVYYPMTPCRVVETRPEYRTPAGPFGPPSLNARETRRFRIPASPHCQVPEGARAYAMTLTVVPQGPLQFLTAWPAGGAQPNVSSINSPSGRILANSVILPASSDGSIDVYAYDKTDLIVDITGYYAPDDGVRGLFYYPVTQCRVADTTNAAFFGPFGPLGLSDSIARTLFVPAAPTCSSIPQNAKAYGVNVTAMPHGSPMPFITAYPTGAPRPNASMLNAFQGQTVANFAIIPAGVNGAIDIYAYRATDVVVEVSGYFGR